MERGNRNKYIDPIFGVCEEFKLTQLPTEADVLKNLLFYQIDGKKYLLFKTYIKNTITRLKNVWESTTIPIITDRSIERKIRLLSKSYGDLKKNGKRILESQGQKFFEEKTNILFDIAACKCDNHCHCDYKFKIPSSDKRFIFDQRTKRELVLGAIDKRATKRAERKLVHNERNVVVPKKQKQNENKSSQISLLKRKDHSAPIINTKRIALSNTAREAQRHGVSLSSVASICNAFMADVGVANADNLIDRSQVQRNIAKLNKNASESHTLNLNKLVDESGCCGIYFDGKKDKTNCLEINEETNAHHPRIINEQHYSILLQPNNVYYTHISPLNCRAVTIASLIFDEMVENQLDLAKIKFIGCDGTVGNTGKDGGRN